MRGRLMQEQQSGEEVRLRITTRAIRHQAWLVVVVVLVLTAAVGAYSFTRTPSYESRAKVVLRPITGNAFSEESSRNSQQVTVAMETEAGLVSSPAVTDLVSGKLGYLVPPGSNAVSATVPANTQIVEIAFSAGSPAKAQAGAEAFATAFLRYRADQATATRGRQLDILNKQATTASESLQVASRESAKVDPPPEAAAQVQLYTSRLASLQDSISVLQATQTDAGAVVTPADRPSGQAGLSAFVLTGLAAIFALLLGVGVGMWRERNDDRLRAEDTDVADLPLLGRLRAETTTRRYLVDPDDAFSQDDYRRIRTVVAAITVRPAVVVFSSVSEEVETSVTAEVTANLALSLRAAGYQVALVDAALGHGGVAEICQIPSSPGLSDALQNERVEPTLTASHGVFVLAAGSNPGAARAVLGGEALPHLLTQLRRRYDFVLVVASDASSAEGSAAAIAADGVVLVVVERTTTHGLVDAAAHRMDVLGSRVLGCVAIRHRSRRARHGGRAAPPDPGSSGPTVWSATATGGSEVPVDDAAMAVPRSERRAAG